MTPTQDRSEKKQNRKSDDMQNLKFSLGSKLLEGLNEKKFLFDHIALLQFL